MPAATARAWSGPAGRWRALGLDRVEPALAISRAWPRWRLASGLADNDRLDLLVNNAGLIAPRFQLSATATS